MIGRTARALLSRLHGRRSGRVPLSHTISLDDPAVAADPFAAYEALRREGGVVHLPRDRAWLVLDDDMARDVLSRPEDFSSAAWNAFDPVLLGADPPRHGVVRRVVARSFGTTALARLEQVARAECARRIGPRLDAAGGLAGPVSRAVATALIGFGPDAASRIRAAETDPDEAGRLHRVFAALDGTASSAEVYDRLLADGEGVITTDDARGLVRLLWLASTVTTERAIAHCALRLATDGALQAGLRADLESVSRFVDEMTRLFPPEMIVRRIAVGDVAIGGACIPTGAEVLVCLGAAGRDPGVHATPAAIDLTGRSRGLSFGHGSHMCIGGPLARRVVAATVEWLLAASRSFELAIAPEDVPFFRTAGAFAPREVPIRMELKDQPATGG